MDENGLRTGKSEPIGLIEKEAKSQMLLDLIASVFRDNPELLFFSSDEIAAIAKIVEGTGRMVWDGS